MRKFYDRLALGLLTLTLCFSFLSLRAQVCQVDSQYTSPGIYPSDTLSDMQNGSAFSQVVQFIFPPDTVYSGVLVEFDSFKVDGIDDKPAWMDWECNQNHPVCTYVTNSPFLTRGCVTVSGTPTGGNAAWPDYDSITVAGIGFITFIQALPIDVDIPVYYRVSPFVGVASAEQPDLEILLHPQPITPKSKFSYTLPQKSHVQLEVYDLQGRVVKKWDVGVQSPGRQTVALEGLVGWTPGTYFLRLNLNGGKNIYGRKLLVR
ncbi:MAG: T9SS type A sorting domain-containing protein [Bacteroidota bacterium]